MLTFCHKTAQWATSLSLSGTSWDPNNAAAKHEHMGGASDDSRGVSVSHCFFRLRCISHAVGRSQLCNEVGEGNCQVTYSWKTDARTRVYIVRCGMAEFVKECDNNIQSSGLERWEQKNTMGKQSLFHSLYNKYSRRNANCQAYSKVFSSFVSLCSQENCYVIVSLVWYVWSWLGYLPHYPYLPLFPSFCHIFLHVI